MPRIRKTGAVYPIRHEQRKTLKDGTVKTYVNWQAKVDGRWVSAKTYKECDRKIAEALKEKTEWGMGVDRATRLGEYAAQWFEMKKRDLKPASTGNYASLISVHLSRYANEKLGEVTASAVQRMIANMRNLDGTPCSYDRQLGFYNILNQIFKAAVADRLIPTSPVTSAARPKRRDMGLAGDRRTINGPVAVSADKRSGTQDRKAFTVKQMQDMLEASSDDLFLGARQWWRLLTGMRQGEILGATLDDLDLWRDKTLETPDSGEIWIGTYTVNWKLESLDKEHGCGEPGRDGRYPCGFKRPSSCPRYRWRVPDGYDMIHLCKGYALTPPKSARGKVVPIIPQLGTVVHRYLEATENIIPNPYNLIFRTREGMPLAALDDRAGFRDLMRRAGIPDYENRYGHECRNSVVSLLFHMKVDAGIIQRIVGHSSIAMSEHYRTVPVEDLMRGMETIGDKLDLKQIEWKA